MNELSGTVTGHAVQARTIREVHLHQEPSAAPRVPRQLPAPVAHFSGRTGELGGLDELLDRVDRVVAVLSGPGGAGKTALALRWAHAVRDRFHDGHLMADLGGTQPGGPVDPGEILGAFLRALGVSPAHVPATLAERVALYRSVSADRSLLAVLDDAHSVAQARVLLPTSTSSAVLVTSRARLGGLVADGAHLVEVGPLPPDDALAMLAGAIGTGRVEREPEDARRLAAVCGGLPIALAVTAARLAARPRLSLHQAVSDLTLEPTRLARLSTMDGYSVEAAFDATFRSLDRRSATLCRRLALHPGRHFGIGLVAVVAQTVESGTGPVAWADPLDVLLEANLLQEIGEDRFTFHDLIRLYGKQRALEDETPDDRETVLRAMMEWYLAAACLADLAVTPYRRRLRYQPVSPSVCLPAIASREAGLDWLEHERANLLAMAAPRWSTAWPNSPGTCVTSCGRWCCTGGTTRSGAKLINLAWPLPAPPETAGARLTRASA